MLVKLHANATTTPKQRAYIQASAASTAQLARELGVSERTVERWRGRDSVEDRSHVPHTLHTSVSPVEERLVTELRAELGLSLDDIVEVMKRCVRPELSRSAVHRCLQRHGLSAPEKRKAPPAGAFNVETPAGFIHLDVKHLPRLRKQRAYAFVAIDRATRFVHLEIWPDRSGATAAGFLERFLAAFPLPVHTVLTDNGAEFTDRFAVDKKHKPDGKPSGQHPFDRLCAKRHIDHRLTRPFRPQTNGMAERFNRRLAEHLAKVPHNAAGHHRRFDDHPQLAAYLLAFVRDYNRTRLKCLGYKAPLEALNNLTGLNTEAGAQAFSASVRAFR